MVMRSPNHRVVRTDGTRACHEIHNTDHTLVARHIRIDLAKGKKTFTWELPDGTKGLGGRAAKTLPLYRSETLRALKPGAMVIVTEGEKAADALAALEFAVVGTVTGASGFPSDDVLRTLDGFHVVMWPDADVIGRKHGGRVLEALYRLRGSATGLSRVDPEALGLTGQGDDAADWTPTDDALDELFAAIQPWTPPAPEPPQPDDEPPPPEDDPEETAAYMVPEGKTRAGLIKALEWVGIAVRFNERSARLELQDAIEAAAGKENWEPSDDLRGAKLREMVADTCVYPGAKGPSRLQFGRERWGDVLDAILDDRRVDPFKEWLNRLAPWDGEQRIDFWLGHIFEVGIIHEAILHWASRSVLMAVVARTFHPGEKHDEMVVLVGPQGIGKSTAWAWVLPGEPERSRWFSDGLSFHDDQKAKAEALQGMVLVEASEMTGSTKAEVETIKKFLSRTNDRIRLTYRRDPPFPLVAPLHDRRHDERPAVSAERPEREPPLCAGAVQRRRRGRGAGLPGRAPRAAVGRGRAPRTGEARDRLPPRRPEARPGRADRALPGGRRGGRGCDRGVGDGQPACTAPGFLDSGLTVFASTLPRPARRGRVAPGRGFDSRISPASTVRCMSA